MTTRTLTGTIKQPDGTVYTGVGVTIELTEDIISSSIVVPAHAIEITTSAVDGTFSVALYVPDTGTAAYTATLPNGEVYSFNFSAGDATTLAVILAIPVVAADPDYILELTTLTVVNKTATYAILATDEVIRCDGTFTVTLPAATGSNAFYNVINVGTGTITIATTGGDTINSATPLTIPTLTSAWYLDGEADNWDSNW